MEEKIYNDIIMSLCDFASSRFENTETIFDSGIEIGFRLAIAKIYSLRMENLKND